MERIYKVKVEAKQPGDSVERGTYLHLGREFDYELIQLRADYSFPYEMKVWEHRLRGRTHLGSEYVSWLWSGRKAARKVIRRHFRRFG